MAATKCGKCGQRVEIINGKLAQHGSGGPGSGLCPGSGSPA